jgi:MoaA/NifB/PqqE/SkfB family radical SAM enzyme
MKKLIKKNVRTIRKFVPRNIRKNALIQSLWRSFQGYSPNNKRKNKLNITVPITTLCNLNCRSCNEFCPVAQEYYLDMNTFEKDCIRLAEIASDRVETFMLTGGEPLLHPQITQFFDIARRHFPSIEIGFISNGILLAKQPETFWQNCKRNNIQITVSNYPIKVDHDAIKRLAEQYNLTLIYPDRYPITEWWKLKLDLSGQQNITKSFKACCVGCPQLREGKLYLCEVLAHIQTFNNYFGQHLEVTERDYVDIYKIQDANEILDFLSNPAPFCRYCDIKGMEHCQKWGLSKKDIAEWT